MLLGERGRITKDRTAGLEKKYSITGFMYTDYPHKSFWSLEFGSEGFKTALERLLSKDKETPLMLYVHIPFCEQLCWFCTCHMLITREYEKVKNYLKWLYREIDLLRQFFDEHAFRPNFREIHLGGGSPTFVYEKDFDELVEKLQSIADLKNLDEFSIEIDPRKVDINRMRYYHSKGINRISFGIQDFDLGVQEAINRVQPAESIENLITPEIRGLFTNGVNFDLICGLPQQTPETIQTTCERIAQMSPDRVCLNYLHYSPQFAPHQKIMFDGRNGRPSQLPGFHERKMIFLSALNTLTKKGYVRTGYDHFAKSTDAVARAMQEKKMRWNSLGVTAGRYADVIGIGVNSLSTLGESYAQNFYELSDYKSALAKGEFPIYRGYHLNQDDVIRRTVIHTLRNFFFLDFSEIEKKYGIQFREYFKEELITLEEFVRDGIVEISDTSLTLTEMGHQFTNLVCRDFDKFYTNNKKAADVGAFFKENQTIAEASTAVKGLIGLKKGEGEG